MKREGEGKRKDEEMKRRKEEEENKVCSTSQINCLFRFQSEFPDQLTSRALAYN